MSILETIQKAEQEAAQLKRDASLNAQNLLRDAAQKAADEKARRVKAALEAADAALESADEKAKADANKLREKRVAEHEKEIQAAREKLSDATRDILGRIVKAV